MRDEGWREALDSSLILLPSSLQFDSELVQLLGVDRRRRFAHQVLRAGGLWKRDDIAQRFAARHQHYDAIKSEGDAAVGRGAVAEGLQKKPEPFARLLGADAQRAEHPRLHFRAIDPDRASA